MSDVTERRWWTLAVLCLSLLIVVVGNTVLNVAIPTLIRELHASTTQLQWIVDAYALVFAGLLFTSGALGDRFGRKGALTVGLVIFGTGSGLAAFSNSADQLIATRALMGLGASLVMPSTLSILTNVFPPHERARAIAIWAGVAGAGGAIGPITSGLVLGHFWWGAIFLINIPIVALALGAGRVLVPTSRDPRRAPLDPVGAGLSILWLSALLFGIIEGPQRGWTSPEILWSFGIAVGVFVVFTQWELRRRAPMLDLRYFTRPSFTGGALAIGLVFFAMYGMFFLMTQYLQFVRNYTPLMAGVALLPMAATMMTVAPMSARVAERIGTKQVVASGLVIVAAGMGVLSRLHAHSSYGLLAGSLVVLAAGMSLTMAPSTASIMSALPLGKAGVGSAMNDTTREIGGALGVAVLGSLLASHYTHRLQPLLHGLPVTARGMATSSVGGALNVASHAGGHAGATLASGARSAYVDAMSSTVLVAGAVALLAAAIIAMVLPTRLGYSEEYDPDRVTDLPDEPEPEAVFVTD